MYSIPQLRLLEAELLTTSREHFKEFFKAHDYAENHSMVVYRGVKDVSCLRQLHAGSGFYLILSNYQASENPCLMEIDGLKVIYRVHSRTVKSRLMSHLMNTTYRGEIKSYAVPYDVCLKLDDKNGIDFNTAPYSDYRWAIVVHKMPDSSQSIREQAELAFDAVFGRPIASREAPRKVPKV